jgi:hypothetical protein
MRELFTFVSRLALATADQSVGGEIFSFQGLTRDFSQINNASSQLFESSAGPTWPFETYVEGGIIVEDPGANLFQ